MFSLESPHRGDSNEYTKHTFFNVNKEIHPKFSLVCSYKNFSKELKNEFETAVVNEPSGFEPLKFYCIYDRESFCARATCQIDILSNYRTVSTNQIIHASR